jgi:hypothetical protein
MNWAKRFILRIQIFTILMAVMCPVFLIEMASKRQLNSYWWPTVPGVVVETTSKTWVEGEKDALFFGRVVYKYTVNGHDYTTDLTDLGPGEKRSDVEAAQADVDRYHPGDPVQVFYDPEHPVIGVIENGIPQVHLIVLVGLSVGSLIGVVGSIFVVRSWLRSYRATKAAADAGRGTIRGG